MPGLGLAIRLVMPSCHSVNRRSSSKVMGSGTSFDSLSSFQNRFENPAKWWPVTADLTPGLIPTNNSRTPGVIWSRRRS
jgi:hypothetical protein